MIVKTLILLSLMQLSWSVQRDENETTVCGIWLAKSTIPGAGLGMFAGKDFQKGKRLLPIGDVVIPLVDMDLHQGEDFSFLWDEYTWDGETLGIPLEGYSDELVIASPGFGAAINCYMDLINVEEVTPSQDPSLPTSLHRWNNPGAGAFSPYWNRTAISKEDISAGDELFASYGNAWFKSRNELMALVPLRGDFKRADRLISKFVSAEKRMVDSQVNSNVLKELWESFVWKNPWDDTSRVLSAIPKKWENVRIAADKTLRALQRKQHSVTIDWLEQNGECGDWITAGRSSLSQAGHGAFGRKPFKSGDVVISLPLIHIPYREVLDMFNLSSSGKKRRASKYAAHTQLLENYCMGHRESTLLLCPYGTLSNYINHNQTLTNVRLEWGDPSKSIHTPSWLEKSIVELSKEYRAGLSMNIVAIRNIDVGEEIFLDYGDDWENAWKYHLRNWISNPMDEHYKSAEQFNMEMKEVKTKKEQSIEPYPSDVKLYFCLAFATNGWLRHWEKGTINEYLATEGSSMNEYVDVEVLSRKVDTNGHTWYDVLVHRGKYRRQRIKGVPRESFRFYDIAYATDMLQPDAFRHDIRIPDSLFPDKWKNVKKPEFPEKLPTTEKIYLHKNESTFDCQEDNACLITESNSFQ